MNALEKAAQVLNKQASHKLGTAQPFSRLGYRQISILSVTKHVIRSHDHAERADEGNASRSEANDPGPRCPITLDPVFDAARSD
jgi:hypothetical protein